MKSLDILILSFIKLLSQNTLSPLMIYKEKVTADLFLLRRIPYHYVFIKRHIIRQHTFSDIYISTFDSYCY